MLVTKQHSHNYDGKATRTRALPPARDAVPVPSCDGGRVLPSDGLWSSGMGQLGKLNEKYTTSLLLNESKREWKNVYKKEAMERESKKVENYKNMPKKKEGPDYYCGWRKAGRDDSSRSWIAVAKSKGKLNGEMGKMEGHSLWEGTANSGMEEMVRGTGTLKCENVQNGDPSWRTQAHKEGWVVKTNKQTKTPTTQEEE